MCLLIAKFSSQAHELVLPFRMGADWVDRLLDDLETLVTTVRTDIPQDTTR